MPWQLIVVGLATVLVLSLLGMAVLWRRYFKRLLRIEEVASTQLEQLEVRFWRGETIVPSELETVKKLLDYLRLPYSHHKSVGPEAWKRLTQLDDQYSRIYELTNSKKGET